MVIRTIVEHRSDQRVELFPLDCRPHLAHVRVETTNVSSYQALLGEVMRTFVSAIQCGLREANLLDEVLLSHSPSEASGQAIGQLQILSLWLD